MEIRKVAVIGAGVMGAGIAAHVSNAGIPVVLLDIVPEAAGNRNAIAEGAVQKMLKAQPAPFMHKRNARLVTTGNIEDNLDLLADCDWIIEAVIEKLDIKQALYEKIDAVRKPGSVVSSNTSTIPLRDLVDGMPQAFAADFIITHFFNPPRYMRLLEVTTGDRTRPEAASVIADFCDRSLGKGVVHCKDTPGFIANRIGIFWIQVAILEAMQLGLSVEEADAVMGKPLGIPKTGVFGLSDLVGIDLMPHLMESMQRTLPKEDPFLEKSTIPELVSRMIAEGYTGRKGKGGFYRINRTEGRKVKESIDLVTGEYSPSGKASLESLDASRLGGLPALVMHPDRGGQYARRVLAQVLGYAASLVPEIADDIVAVDQAMKLGYAWKFGPFELIDKLGAENFVQLLEEQGIKVPGLLEKAAGQSFYRTQEGRLQYLDIQGRYQDVLRPEGVLLLSDIKRSTEPLAQNGSAALWDIGDGVVCLEYTSKMNAMDPDILALMREAVDIVKRGYKALVLHNEGENYSVGANLGLLLFAANIGTWDQIEEMVEAGQESYRALKYAPFPVVGAPSGMALGGGCETLLHCDAIQAHAETYIGLVEVGVGLVPGWGGCKEMLQRWISNKRRPGGPMPAVIKCFETISTATVAKSAAEAKDSLFFRADDGISMNRDRLLADAKARALALAEDYQPPEPIEISLPGPTAKAAMKMAVDGVRLAGKATRHDVVVSMRLAELLSGGDTDITEMLSEEDLLRLEREAFMDLVRNPDTLDRMEHMLETGKPLRN
ncbi:MAG: 3-hydroxyacyl-CoA dehydrogenase NAD-binding domain-containing protein [Sedimenticola sp.]|nr:3-hydroxyacyl-CoA dehydrogenase NAD-binding domain-containing protein [Sedimenticola sp.]